MYVAEQYTVGCAIQKPFIWKKQICLTMSPPILIKQTKSKNSSNGAVRKKLNFHIFLKSQNKERSEDLLILSARCWTGVHSEDETRSEVRAKERVEKIKPSSRYAAPKVTSFLALFFCACS